MPSLFKMAPTSRHEVRARAKQIAYLNDAGRIRTALINEFGIDVPIPSRAFLQAVVDERRAGFERFRRNADKSAALRSAA